MRGYTMVLEYFVGYTSLNFFLWGYTNLNLSFVKRYQNYYFRRESHLDIKLIYLPLLYYIFLPLGFFLKPCCSTGSTCLFLRIEIKDNWPKFKDATRYFLSHEWWSLIKDVFVMHDCSKGVWKILKSSLFSSFVPYVVPH